MEIEKSRNGFYTITFTNKNNLDEKEIHREFSTVGNVCKIIKNFQRIFIRFREKDEAERALIKFGKVYDVDMAKNNKASDNHQHEGGYNHNHKRYNHHTTSSSMSEESNLSQSIDKLNLTNQIYHLILGNLPKTYTLNDIKALIEEAKPVFINQLEETRVFNLKYCHVVLSSIDSLNYLIDKLNGFVICGEKLIAAEAKHLLEWREKSVSGLEVIGPYLERANKEILLYPGLLTMKFSLNVPIVGYKNKTKKKKQKKKMTE